MHGGLTSAATKRVMIEIKKFNEYIEKYNHSMRIQIFNEDISNLQAILIGSEGIPYFGGTFILDINYPEQYPMTPPNIKITNTNMQKTRWGPNFYADGKICLSIIGTWSGPSWTPSLTLDLLLQTILSMLNEDPYHNEPGYEKHIENDNSCKLYKIKIMHETIKLAVCEIIDHIVMVSTGKIEYNPHAKNLPKREFYEFVLTNFLKNVDVLIRNCIEHTDYDNKVLSYARFEGPTNGINIVANFTLLAERLMKLKQIVEDLLTKKEQKQEHD
jgi:ubiquitin-protein ligase